MWNDPSDKNDIANNILAALKAGEAVPEMVKQATTDEAIGLLIKASDTLDSLGLDRQSTKLLKLVKKLSWYVPSSDSPKDSAKMTSNLENKGWVFDADDGCKDKDKSMKADDGTATNLPQSKDLSTGLTAKKMVDSLGPGMTTDTSMDDDAAKKPDSSKPDPEKPFNLPPKAEKPATTPVEPVGVMMPKAEPLKQ
jgi:hypothetical protein